MLGYGCANTAFAGLAIQLVVRRELGILKRLRATPLSAVVYIAATLASTLHRFRLAGGRRSSCSAASLRDAVPDARRLARARVVLGAVASPRWASRLRRLIRSGEGSSAVVNFILLPMSFLTGSFGPTHRYPAFLRAIGDVLPLKYFIDLVNAVYLHEPFDSGRRPDALGVLAAWGVAGLVVAALKFRWEPREG